MHVRMTDIDWWVGPGSALCLNPSGFGRCVVDALAMQPGTTWHFVLIARSMTDLEECAQIQRARGRKSSRAAGRVPMRPCVATGKQEIAWQLAEKFGMERGETGTRNEVFVE